MERKSQETYAGGQVGLWPPPNSVSETFRHLDIMWRSNCQSTSFLGKHVVEKIRTVSWPLDAVSHTAWADQVTLPGAEVFWIPRLNQEGAFFKATYSNVLTKRKTSNPEKTQDSFPLKSGAS